MRDPRDARAEVLRRVRAGLRDVPATERPEDVAVPRDYRRTGDLPREAIVARFAERVREYRATVWRIEAAKLANSIAQVCAARRLRTLVVPADLPEEWEPPRVEILRDDGLSDEALDGVDGVLTGCALGIAQTGTIVLDAGPVQGRRALTLIPDYHLCVIFERQIVGIVPEAIARLAEAAAAGRPITFISGPSATSDIELRRVEGVHGPRTLEVLVVAD